MSKKKKINSYIKFLLWMVLGGAIGGILAVGMLAVDDGLGVWLDHIADWIYVHTVVLMAVLAAVALFMCMVCYKKGEAIGKRFRGCADDEGQEQLDGSYSFWSTMGTVAATMMIHLALGIFAFSFRLESDEDAMHLLVSAALLLVVTVICAFYQIAVVKQMRKKDPMKQGDAADLFFCRDWLRSCDEAERYMVYEAGYKTYSEMKTILLMATVIAMTSELFLGRGLMAAVLLILCNMLSAILYTVHSLRLEKGKRMFY